MHHLQHRFMTAVHVVAARLRAASLDDRGELNSNVAWAGLMLVIAVSVAGMHAREAGGPPPSADRIDEGLACLAHARRLFKKLGASDRAHAVALGFRWGLVR